MINQLTRCSINKVILLVEDNLLLRELGKESIESFGYIVKTANNGQEAIELSDKYLFDLILLDIQMPILDGLKTLKRMRQRESVPSILALTGAVSKEDQIKYKEAGFTDTLHKPYTIKDCHLMIQKYI